MRILIHDYAGHPFQVQLSRKLAARGHEILHLYAASVAGPHGALTARADDPEALTIAGVALGRPISKYSLVKRRFQEVKYGRLLAARTAGFRPDAVLAANTPLESLAPTLRHCRRNGVRFVNWTQDIYGTAVDRLLRKKLPGIGAAVGAYYLLLERRQLKRSDHLILISEDFRQFTDPLRIPSSRIDVIPNWAPLDEIIPAPRHNRWAIAQGLADRFVYLYSGTLGMKHDPELLLRLAQDCRDPGSNAAVVVVSEGIGADWLRDRAAEEGMLGTFMYVLPFQPYAALSDVLATGDVLIAILEPDAGVFSVPSKVLSYLCAGGALLLGVPPENLAARTVAGAGAGIVVAPEDSDGFVREGRRLREAPSLVAEMAACSRAYAEKNFDIEAIADRFEQILRG